MSDTQNAYLLKTGAYTNSTNDDTVVWVAGLKNASFDSCNDFVAPWNNHVAIIAN